MTARCDGLWPGAPVTLPARVRLDGELVEIPSTSTHCLLTWLAVSSPAGQWWMLLMLPAVERRIVNPGDTLDYHHLYPLGQALWTGLTGIGDLGLAHRIARRVLTGWLPFAVWCARHGVDPDTATLRRVLAAGIAWLADTMDPKDFQLLVDGSTSGEMSPAERAENTRRWLAAAGG